MKLGKYFLFFLIFVWFCKQAKLELTQSELEAIIAIFEENQKLQETLLNSEVLPKIEPLKNSIEKAKVSIQNSQISEILNSLQTSLSAYSESDKEKAFLSLSSFSENLDKLSIYVGLKEYHKFFCPMVSKYWVAKGESIHNPYASEMRECGELVR